MDFFLKFWNSTENVLLFSVLFPEKLRIWEVFPISGAGDSCDTLIFVSHCFTLILHQVILYIEEHRTELEAEAGKDKLQVTKLQYF